MSLSIKNVTIKKDISFETVNASVILNSAFQNLMIEFFNLTVQLQMKSDLFNETLKTHDYRLAVNNAVDDINIEIFKQLKAMSL